MPRAKRKIKAGRHHVVAAKEEGNLVTDVPEAQTAANEAGAGPDDVNTGVV